MLSTRRTHNSIASFITHRAFRQQLLKDDFFDQIIKKVQTDLSSEENDFLFQYLLQEKYGEKDIKEVETPIDEEKQNQSPLDLVDTSLYQNSSNRLNKRNFTACQTLNKRIHRKTHSSIKKSSFNNSMTGGDNFQRTTPIKEFNSKIIKRQKPKFNKISFTIKKKQENYNNRSSPHEYHNIKYSMISRQQLLKNYNEGFISNIFQRHTFQITDFSIPDEEFREGLSFRKTDQFEEERLKQENKYQHITSIQFGNSPKRRLKMKVNTRKF